MLSQSSMSYSEGDVQDALPLLDNISNTQQQGIEQREGQCRHNSTKNADTLPSLSSFDIESSVNSVTTTTTPAVVRERQQQQRHHQRVVARPSRGLQIATPTPFEPITDPFAFVCDIAQRPKFGHMYVLCPERSRKRGDRGVGLSVGPHWAGVIYTMSMIGIITLFLAKVLIGPDVAPWCQPLIVACSFVTIVFLLATAMADPGIVVESAQSGESGNNCGYCEECSIWTPQGAEHCEEW